MQPSHAQQQMREFIYAQMALHEACTILDLGCGKGQDLQALGARAGATARIVGMDNRSVVIEAAQAATAGDERFTFLQGDVAAVLPFADESFDLVYSINLLECLVDKAAHLREVHRVLKPGGQVVYVHFDWDSQLFDGTDKALVRRIVQTYNDWQQAWMAACDAWMGRRLWRTFQQTGLFTGMVHPYVLTETNFTPGTRGYETAQDFAALVRREMIRQEEYDAFLADLQALAEQDQFLYSITMYAYAGRKR